MPEFRSTAIGSLPTGPAPDARALRRSVPDRVMRMLQHHRGGGRRSRTVRRAIAILLLAVAAVLAIAPRPQSGDGTVVVTAARDLPPGTTLQAADLATALVAAPPDGAVKSVESLVGEVLAGAIRRGEVLTDVRVLGDRAPSPGPGRRAVPVRPQDSGTVALLTTGMHVAVVGVDPNGAARTLTDDAIVLWMPPSETSQPGPMVGRGTATAPTDLVVLAVPEQDADKVATTAMTGAIGLMFP